VEWIKLA